MDYDNNYQFDTTITDFKDFQMRSLNRAVKTLEFILEQKNLEIERLKEQLKRLEDIFFVHF